ncbi:MAG TPA: sulfotransferase [Caulobacteraceae bacterium]|nr:sulfotransferase [Caulobacteraceae bacterium]
MEAAAAPPQTLEEGLAAVRRLQATDRHADALDAVRVRLTEVPGNRDLLLIEAVSLRHLSRIDEALAVIDRLEQAHPHFSQAHQERGLCYVALKDAGSAIEALLRAVNINPALPVSWRMLEGVYRIVGDGANATVAAAHVATLKHLPPEVVAATSLFFDGDLAPAERMIRTFLLRHGDHPEAMRLLAKIGMAQDVLDDAETLLDAALVLAPDHRAARAEYAQVLIDRHKYAKARKETDRLLALDPANPGYRQLAAACAIGLGETERAIELYQGLLAETPASSDLNLWLGHALKTVSRVPEAIEAYRAAGRARPGFGEAYWSLANLKTYRFSSEEMDRMRSAEAAPETPSQDRQYLCFALGKALEDQGRIAESWRCYARGNAIARAGSRYRPEIFETNTKKQTEVCPHDFFAARRGWGVADPDPIFIVGLPRSGSTLIEQILASHSQVEGTQELPDIQRIALELQGRDPDLDDPRYPGTLAQLSKDEVRRLGERYLAETQVYRTDKPFFVDKMPNNFRHIGLIHLILPNARIIDARREPMACCFSNLKQLFARGQEFAYSEIDIARYYRTYLDLMRHWDEALPGRVLRVHHEDVVEDLEGQVRRLLDHCGLAFERACVDFHETRRAVRTPSSEQVRRPIFRDGLDQWRRYEAHLGPLRDALGDAMSCYRD